MPTSYEWQYMGDRTSVTLYVLTAQKDEALELIGEESSEEGEVGIDSGQYYFSFEQVNYGNLLCLAKLREHGIAYESAWEAGDEYGPGTEYLRFTPDGEAVEITVYDSDQNPDLHKLLAHINNYDELREVIISHKKNITPLPWDNQVEYGKIYRMTQLVTTS